METNRRRKVCPRRVVDDVGLLCMTYLLVQLQSQFQPIGGCKLRNDCEMRMRIEENGMETFVI